MKWYARKGNDSTGGCVKTSKALVGESVTEWVCFLQKQDDEELNKSRRELIALLPELVEAAEVLNAVAVPTANTVPAVRRALVKADKIVRKAKALLDNEPPQHTCDGKGFDASCDVCVAERADDTWSEIASGL
jgi:hypothetical protein